jgi:hypothetical protein
MAIIKNISLYDAARNEYVKVGEEATHEGRVLRVYNRDFRAMSDVYTYATYADVIEDNGAVKEVMVNANFECDTSGGRAIVDATDEAIAWNVRWCHEQSQKYERLVHLKQLEKLEEERNRPTVGKRMIVVRGRKVPVGHQGTVAYINREGSVLVKADHEWQDRKAGGVWVPAAYLKAV